MKLFLSHAGLGEVAGGVELYAAYLKKVFSDMQVIDYHSLKAELGDTAVFALREPLRASKLGAHIKKNYPDAETIFTNGMFCWNLGKKSEQFNICHGSYPAFAQGALNPLNPDYYRLKYIYGTFEKIAAKNAKKIISNSEQTKANVRKYFKSASQVIYPPVDTDLFRPIQKEKARKFTKWKGTNVLFVGRPEHAKGFDFVQELADANPQINFKCVLSRTFESNTPNLHVIGKIDHSKLPNYYCSADAVLFPSRFEGFGLVTAEALACSRNIVCLDTGIAGEIESDNIFISKPDANSLNSALKIAIESSPKNSCNTARKKFSFELFRKKWKNALS